MDVNAAYVTPAYSAETQEAFRQFQCRARETSRETEGLPIYLELIGQSDRTNQYEESSAPDLQATNKQTSQGNVINHSRSRTDGSLRESRDIPPPPPSPRDTPQDMNVYS